MSDEVRFEKKPAKKGPKKTFAQSFFPQKGDSSSEIINKIIVLISIVVLIVCAVLLGDYFYQMYEAKQNHNTLKVIYQQAQLQQSQSSQDKTDDVPAETDENTPPEELPPLEELAAAKELLAINPDTVGYVRIPDCVDEPVVKGTDNEYYLKHNFYNNQRQCGTCFADYRNKVGGYERSDNIILYAHNQKDGTVSSGYRESGYFPEAVINFLALLGWHNTGDQEMFTMDELIQQFSLDRVSKSGAKFDYEKGKWFNHQYLQLKSNDELADLFMPVLAQHGVTADKAVVAKVIGLTKDRVNFVPELWEQTNFFFVAPTEYDEKSLKKRWKEDSPRHMQEL